MSEESTTPDPVELVHRQVEAANRRDLDAFMHPCPPDGVYDTSPSGLGVYQGPAAIRAFIKEWWDAFEELRFEAEEVLDLGNGVTLLVLRHDGRPVGSTGRVQTRQASVIEWVAGTASRVTVYTDIAEGRAAAERLAAERGWAMSDESVQVIRRAVEAFNAGDVEAMLALADPELEWRPAFGAATDGATAYHGHVGFRDYWRGTQDISGSLPLRARAVH